MSEARDYPLWLPERGRRIFWFPLTRFVLAMIFFIAFVGLAMGIVSFLTASLGGSVSKSGLSALRMVLTCTAAVAGYWLYCRWIENRKMIEMNPQKLMGQTGLGLLLGFGFISLIMLLMAAFGSYKISGLNPAAVLVPVLIMSLQAGIVEEILSRGIIFRIAEEGIGTWLSVILSAFIFGFLHSWNPNATVFSSVSIALTAGVILAMLYVLTRQLWIVIGIHIAWNFTLGGIYGAPVSGGDPAGLFKASFPGPDWITGGSFGPEASVITLGVFILFGIFLIRKSIRNKSYIKPLWMKKND